MSSKKCLSDDEFIALLLGEKSSHATGLLLGHIALCPVCSFRFDFLNRLRAEAEPKIADFTSRVTPSEAGPLLHKIARERLAELAARETSAPVRLSPPRRSRLMFRFAFGLLGVLLIAAAAGYLTLNHLRERAVLRSPALKLELLEPVGKISRPPAIFRWTPVLHAEDYRLELIDDSLQPVYSSGTYLVTEHAIPAEVRAMIVRGRTYVWSIKALDGDGNLLLSESGHFRWN